MKPASQRTGRILLALASIVVLIWLYCSAPQKDFRKKDIKTQISTGPLVQFDPQFAEELTSEFQELAKASEKPLPEITVNKGFQANTLPVFITTPETEDTTKCGQGNAVYDPDLDAIFIDVDVLKPMLNTSSYGSPRVEHGQPRDPVARAYRDFLFLHELGHRVLHRSKGRIYDYIAEPRKLEDEADTFALLTMEQFFEHHTSSEFATASDAARFKLPVEVSGRDEALVVVAQMVYEINQGFLFSNLRQSPYSVDRAHRRFVERAENLLETASKVATSTDVRSYIELAREYCRRISASAPLLDAEISTPSQMTGVEFGKSWLYLLDSSNRLYQVPYSTLNSSHEHAPSMITVSAEKSICSSSNNAPLPSRHEGENLIIMESTDVELWIAKTGMYRCVRGEWQLDEEWKQFHSEKWAYVQLDRTTVGRFVAVTEDKTASQWNFEFFDQGRSVASTNSSKLASQTNITALSPSCVNPFFEVTSDLSAMSFSCGAPQRHGFCDFDVEDLFPSKCHLVEPGSIADAALDQGTLTAIGTRGQRTLYAVQAIFDPYTPHTSKYQLQVVKFDDTGNATIVATHDLILEKLPQNANPFDWLTVSHPPVVTCDHVPPNGIACSLFQDSAYLFDAHTNSFKVVFHPAGTILTSGKSGLLAVANGWKVYLLDLSNINGSSI